MIKYFDNENEMLNYINNLSFRQREMEKYRIQDNKIIIMYDLESNEY